VCLQWGGCCLVFGLKRCAMQSTVVDALVHCAMFVCRCARMLCAQQLCQKLQMRHLSSIATMPHLPSRRSCVALLPRHPTSSTMTHTCAGNYAPACSICSALRLHPTAFPVCRVVWQRAMQLPVRCVYSCDAKHVVMQNKCHMHLCLAKHMHKH
jgi:hypothetical protein